VVSSTRREYQCIYIGVYHIQHEAARVNNMIAPHQEHEYFQWFLREEALDWQSLQENSRDILQQIPEAEGLAEFHLSRDCNGE